MLCARLSRLSFSNSDQNGSGVTGFVLVAPLLCLVLMTGFTLGGLVMSKINMQANVRQAARWAALLGSNSSDVREKAQESWVPAGFNSCGSEFQISHNTIGVTKFVSVRVINCLELPLLRKAVSLTVTESEVDERAL